MAKDKVSLANVFVPDDSFESIYDIHYQYLQKHGVKGLLLDMDNTLIARTEQTPSLRCLSWIADLKEKGIKLCILSNNTDYDKVIYTAQYLDIPAVCRAYKPLPLVARKAIFQLFSLSLGEVMIVGDQYYTDVACGNLLGLRSVVVEPLGPELTSFRKWLIRVDQQLPKIIGTLIK